MHFIKSPCQLSSVKGSKRFATDYVDVLPFGGRGASKPSQPFGQSKRYAQKLVTLQIRMDENAIGVCTSVGRFCGIVGLICCNCERGHAGSDLAVFPSTDGE